MSLRIPFGSRMSTREQRSAERYRVNATTACAFASPVLEDFGAVTVMNISTTGIGLITAEEVQPDLMFVIKLVNPAKKFNRLMLVRIVHVTPQADGSYLVGGKFETPLSNDEFCTVVM
jgi:hypothetical protein